MKFLKYLVTGLCACLLAVAFTGCGNKTMTYKDIVDFDVKYVRLNTAVYSSFLAFYDEQKTIDKVVGYVSGVEYKAESNLPASSDNDYSFVVCADDASVFCTVKEDGTAFLKNGDTVYRSQQSVDYAGFAETCKALRGDPDGECLQGPILEKQV